LAVEVPEFGAEFDSDFGALVSVGSSVSQENLADVSDVGGHHVQNRSGAFFEPFARQKHFVRLSFRTLHRYVKCTARSRAIDIGSDDVYFVGYFDVFCGSIGIDLGELAEAPVDAALTVVNTGDVFDGLGPAPGVYFVVAGTAVG